MSFEVHITSKTEFRDTLKELANTIDGWSYSQIDGDPTLGPGVKAYLTYHTDNLLDAIEELTNMDNLCSVRGVKVLRTKIESILLDQSYD